jgi:capsular polysaccharide biosynthesis protein
MDLRKMIKVLLRWWWLVLLPVIVVAAYVGMTYQPPATTYQIVMRYAAGTEPAGLSVDYDRYYPWLTSEYVANGLADVAETRAFADAVVARLAEAGHSVQPGAVQGAIVTDNAQSILVVYLTWPDAAQIVPVAGAITEELTENGAAYYPQMTDVGPVVRPLDPPEPRPLAPSLRAQLLGPGLRLMLAVAVGLGLAFLAHYLDPTVRERAEIEAQGVSVRGVIPR